MLRRWAWAGVLAAGMLAGCGGGAVAPDKAVQGTLVAVADGKLDVAWDALPASYQADVDGLVHEFGGQVDAKVYNEGFGVLTKAVKLLKDKKTFILGSPLLKQAGQVGVPSEKVVENYDVIVKILDAIATSDLKSTETLKKFSVKSFLGTTGKELVVIGKSAAALAPGGDEGLKAYDKLAKIKVTPVKVEGTKATLKIEAPDEKPTEEEFVQIEGKWIPKKLADDWKNSIDKAKGQLSGLKIPAEQKASVLGGISFAGGVLDSLLETKSQEEFDKAVGGLTGGGAAAAPPVVKEEKEEKEDKEEKKEEDK